MIFSVGVATFTIWHAAALWLIVSSPLVWIYGRRTPLIVHLVLVGCHYAMFSAAAMHAWLPPGGDHDAMLFWAKRYLDVPIGLIDVFVLLVRSRARSTRSAFRDAAIIVVFPAAVFCITSWAAPIWLLTVPETILVRARDAARGRPYCLDAGRQQDPDSMRLTMDRLDDAFSGGGGVEYNGYYALLDIDGEPARNWSFRAGDFLPASPYFSASCKPVVGGNLH